MKNVEQINALVQIYREGDYTHEGFLKDMLYLIDEEDFDLLKELAVTTCEILERRIFKDISSRVKDFEG